MSGVVATWVMEKKEVADGDADENKRPVAKHHPLVKHVSPHKTLINAVLVPNISSAQEVGLDEDFEEWALQLNEWLGLVGIESPRVVAGDSIDPYLSRYNIPFSKGDSLQPRNMIRLTWFGLLPSPWIRRLFIEIR